MLQVNLLPWRQAQRERRKQFWLWQTVATFALCLLLFGILLWWVQRELAVQRDSTELLQKTQASLNVQLKKVSETKLQLRALQDVARQHQQRYDRGLGYLTLLETLSRNIPDNLWLTHLTEESEGHIRLRGATTVYHSVTAFAQSLRDDPVFAEVLVLEMQRQADQSVEFVMLLGLVNLPDSQ